MKCNCEQYPKLRQTGWGSPHAEWYCPICSTKYYESEEGITDIKPVPKPTAVMNPWML
jgi:hypothetical protein